MKSTFTLSKLTIAAAALLAFNSCNKETDQLNNLDAFRKDDSQAQLIDINAISNTTTWEDRVNGVDYIVANNIELNAALIIKPGVTVMFKEGAGLQVNEEGSLNAIGQQANEILFTSESGKRGAWKGITILSNKPTNALSFCKIEHGGGTNSFGKGNVVVGSSANTASVEISNSEITAGKYDGVVINEGSSVTHFNGNKIHTNSEYPVSMHIADAAAMNNSNTFSNNGKEFVRMFGSGENVINKAITINKLNSNVLIDGNIVAGNMFTIHAGAKIFMNTNAGIIIDGSNGQGMLSAIGSSTSPITISAIYNGTGVWNSIKFRSSDADNRIEYCNISGGGLSAEGFEGMINLVNQGGSSNVVVRNSNIMNSASAGIFIQSNNEYNSDITTANVFTNCAKGNVHFE
ncbi:MAG: hypothetical protein IPH78_03800 [Bacteroidetes bacterium]|nr:hypothetical protein [Bacteroidota bacterium]